VSVDSAQDFHKGRFSGAVFPDYGVYFTILHRQVDRIQRNDSVEMFGYIAHLQMYICHISLSSKCVRGVNNLWYRELKKEILKGFE